MRSIKTHGLHLLCPWKSHAADNLNKLPTSTTITDTSAATRTPKQKTHIHPNHHRALFPWQWRHPFPPSLCIRTEVLKTKTEKHQNHRTGTCWSSPFYLVLSWHRGTINSFIHYMQNLKISLLQPLLWNMLALTLHEQFFFGWDICSHTNLIQKHIHIQIQCINPPHTDAIQVPYVLCIRPGWSHKHDWDTTALTHM